MNQLQFYEDRKVEMKSTASRDKDSSAPRKKNIGMKKN